MSSESNLHTDAAALAARFINKTNRDIFLTGKAGTGKTTFLRNIVLQTHKNAIVAAPTGIAAINAGGVTLHSLFQLPFGSFIPASTLSISGNISVQLNTRETLLRNLQMHASKRKLLQEMELLIIDEVSMLRADLLDAIDTILRSVRRNRSEPFGGVQVLFIGDLFQLPPVVKQEEWEYLKPWYPDIWFFSAQVLRARPPLYIELDKIYRQTDREFITLLNHFRDDCVTHDDLELLNGKYNPDLLPEDLQGYIYLTTHNRKADAINHQALRELPGCEFCYHAVTSGDFSEFLYPVEECLELKEGAQVMFIKNDYSGEQRYFNGRIGTISELSEEEIWVSFDDGGPDVPVERYTWENKKYTLDPDTNEIETKIAGTFSHYPIKLAWAITIHKSQGLTFQKAIIDVSAAFAPGQIYVALSRLVSLDGLVLSSRLPMSGPPSDGSIKEFIGSQDVAALPVTVLEEEIRSYLRSYIVNSFNFSDLEKRLHRNTEGHNMDRKRSVKQKYHDWARQLEEDFRTVRVTAGKFQDQAKRLISLGGADYQSRLLERLDAALDYFSPILEGFRARVVEHLSLVQEEKKTKTYQGELRELERAIFKQNQSISKARELVRSTIEGTDLTRESWQKAEVNQARSEQIAQRAGKKRKRGSGAARRSRG